MQGSKQEITNSVHEVYLVSLKCLINFLHAG